MDSILCPHCDTDLAENGVDLHEVYICSFDEENQYFTDGLFDQTIFICPECGEAITDFIEEKRLY